MDEIQNLVIKGTYKTPQIDFNQQNGELVLTGRSIPENATQIYQPLLSWITKYIKSPNQTTNFHLKLKYYNSASTFWLIKIIKELTRITQKDSVLIIHLYFDIDDFNNMDMEELNSFVSGLIDNLNRVKISIGLKTYGVDINGKILKESMIYI